MTALEYLDSLRITHPELSDWCGMLTDLYQRSLWHELTIKLEEFIQLSVFDNEKMSVYSLWFKQAKACDVLIGLYRDFITDFETKIDLLKHAQFASIVSYMYPKAEASISFLEGVIEKVRATKVTRIEEPILHMRMQIALFHLAKGDRKQCQNLLEDGRAKLDSMTSIDPSVHANYYWASLRYHRSQREFFETYNNGLLFLEYTSVESLSDSVKLLLAYDLSMSALLGDGIYDFRTLLAHPIIEDLLGTENQWIHDFLKVFTIGNIDCYMEVWRCHDVPLRSQPYLSRNRAQIFKKFEIMCVMEIFYRRPCTSIPLRLIALLIKSSIENVEKLLMKCLSVHLLEGKIDQVDGVFHVSWVQPRVLHIRQVKSLRERLDKWMRKVQTALASVETPDFIAS